MRGKGEGTGCGSWMASILLGVLLVARQRGVTSSKICSLVVSEIPVWPLAMRDVGIWNVALATSLGMGSSISCLVVAWEIVPVLGNPC